MCRDQLWKCKNFVYLSIRQNILLMASFFNRLLLYIFPLNSQHPLHKDSLLVRAPFQPPSVVFRQAAQFGRGSVLGQELIKTVSVLKIVLHLIWTTSQCLLVLLYWSKNPSWRSFLHHCLFLPRLRDVKHHWCAEHSADHHRGFCRDYALCGEQLWNLLLNLLEDSNGKVSYAPNDRHPSEVEQASSL